MRNIFQKVRSICSKITDKETKAKSTVWNNRNIVSRLLWDKYCVQSDVWDIIKLKAKYCNLDLNESLIEQIYQLSSIIDTQKDIWLLPLNFDINIEVLPDNVSQKKTDELPTLNSLLFTENLCEDNILNYIATLFCADSLWDKRCIDVILQTWLTPWDNISPKWFIIHDSLLKELEEDNIENRKKLLLFIMNNIYLNFKAYNPEENPKINFTAKRRILNNAVKNCKKMFNKKVSAVRINYMLWDKIMWKWYLATSNNPLIERWLNTKESMELLFEWLNQTKKILHK